MCAAAVWETLLESAARVVLPGSGMTTAEEIMTENPTTVSEDTTLRDALELMQDGSIRHLPVLREGLLVGMLSDRDVQSLGLRLVTDLESMERVDERLSATVGSVMSPNVLSVSRVAELGEVIDLLVEEKVGAVPVVDEGALVGILSYVDVLRVLRDSVD